MFWLPGNNQLFECELSITHKKVHYSNWPRSSEALKKLYLQWINLKKISIDTSEVIKLSKNRLFSIFRVNSHMEAYFGRLVVGFFF